MTNDQCEWHDRIRQLLACACAAAVACGCHGGRVAKEVGAGAKSKGVIVLAGGGSEATHGEADGWSARLYRNLLRGGDISGDGKIQVALLAARPQSEWLCRYFEWLGADRAFNVPLATQAAADDAGLESTLGQVDAIFIKGGEQGRYYDLWNNRRIERIIQRVFARGGGVGGTSAGAMSLAEFAITGGKSFTSEQVRADSHSPWLDDVQGGSAIHTDFLGLVPRYLIDTHFSQRGRFVRLVSALGKAHDDALRARRVTAASQPRNTSAAAEAPWGAIGIDERTGIVISTSAEGQSQANVIGEGVVTLIVIPRGDKRGGGALDWQSPFSRIAGKPLSVSGLWYSQYRDGDVLALGAGAVGQSR